uniref:Secreted protein n=1 Tax=Steinernema glaseri TaxID=37863 RepID=A0A1I7YQI1_9BILA
MHRTSLVFSLAFLAVGVLSVSLREAYEVRQLVRDRVLRPRPLLRSLNDDVSRPFIFTDNDGNTFILPARPSLQDVLSRAKQKLQASRNWDGFISS